MEYPRENIDGTLQTKSYSQFQKEENKLNKVAKTVFHSIFRTIDLFGHPIQLTYNGSNSYKTSAGGIITILSIIISLIVVISCKSKPFIRDQLDGGEFAPLTQE